MSEALPLRYRPKTFDEFVGNESSINAIKSMIERDLEDIPSSWLITGDSGCGKTTIARILKNELQCNDLCFSEYNSSNTRGIDTIRKVQEYSRMAPMVGESKVFLFDECHMLTKEAQNAMLKMLEDSPKNTFYILATTNPEKLIKPIHSRCVKVAVTPLSSKLLLPYLRDISDEEGVDISSDILSMICKASGGVPRDAVKMLDAVLDLEDEVNMKAVITSSILDEVGIFDFCKLLLDEKTKWKEISDSIRTLTQDPETIRRSIIGILSGFLLNDGSTRTAAVLECFMENYFDSGKAGLVYSCFATRHL